MDALTPLGIAKPVLYTLVVLIALRSSRPGIIIAVMIACTVLTVGGYWLSGPTLEPWKAMVNRGLSLLVIWTTGLIGLQRLALAMERQQLMAEREELLSRALGRFIPMCAWCRKVRDERESWQPLEDYVIRRAETSFSHGICPSCHRDVAERAAENDPPASSGTRLGSVG